MDLLMQYWDQYYAAQTSKRNLIPSQFCVFVLGEASGVSHVVDIGCGNGRDSLYMAATGLNVLGVDASSQAIKLCKSYSSTATFETAEVGCEAECKARAFLEKKGKALVYARFFLHALTEEAEDRFFALCRSVLSSSDQVALEFRTQRDAEQKKETPTHYRRFIDPLAVIVKASKYELVCEYFVEGFGFAKFKNDDAHVARMILRKV
jgi:cyclopropane fatty-acyl-phospholipid synthase-like methyltransferase